MEEVWKILRQTKTVSYHCYEDREVYSHFYPQDLIQTQINEVEKHLQVNASNEPREDMTDSILEIAADMFLLLNSCPKTLKTWFLFYADLFENHSLDMIVLKLNRILKGKTTSQNEPLKIIAMKLFNRITSDFSLMHPEYQRTLIGKRDSTWITGSLKL